MDETGDGMAHKRVERSVAANKGSGSKRGERPLLSLWLGIAVVSAFALGGALLNGNFRQAAPDTSFSITSPVSGSTLSGPIDLNVALSGTTLGTPTDGLDHLHISLDGGQPLALYENPELSLPPLSGGEHTIIVELAGPSHQALLPAQSVSFVVR